MGGTQEKTCRRRGLAWAGGMSLLAGLGPTGCWKRCKGYGHRIGVEWEGRKEGAFSLQGLGARGVRTTHI